MTSSILDGEPPLGANGERRKSVSDSLQDSSIEHFQLAIDLSNAKDLKAMDKNGFSDPYARFLMNGEILCKSDTKKKCLNPVWNQTFAVKIPASRGKLVVEVYDHDVIGSNDLIGCSEIDLGPLIIEERSKKTLVLRPALNSPPNPKLGTINFSVTVSPLDETAAETALEGRRKGDKKIIGTVILRLLEAYDIKPLQGFKGSSDSSRNPSVKLRMDKHKELSKMKKKTLSRKFHLKSHGGLILTDSLGRFLPH